MRVFLTGATGFIGSYLVPDLLGAGHEVRGLCRSDEAAEKLARAGGEPFRGDVNDLGRVRAGAEASDGVIHAAFNHDFAQIRQHSESDRKVIEALGEVLAGSKRPLIVTSGTGLVERSAAGGPVVETDAPPPSEKVPRAATEEAADAVFAKGVHVVVMRLPQVHDTRHQGRIAHHIRLAREKGRVAYIGDGQNRLPAVHVSDAVRLFRLALQQGRVGARYHAVAEEGVPLRDIADVIGAGLNLPVESITHEAAAGYFGMLAGLAGLDLAASSALTRQELPWTPTGPDLLTDLRQMDWAA
ncbi:MAG: SDR family oxidoreductase [Proteobacteria bacterium]|nr:SDR family oxidoreductase [Pseudomonadota bacterium]